MNRKEVLAAVRGMSPSKDFVWDGVDEAERPATRQELQAGVNASRRRGRPVSDVTKEQVAIRFDRDVLRMWSGITSPSLNRMQCCQMVF